MIKALEGLDRTVAAGVLARAALSLGYVDNPLVSLKSDDERIYTTVVNEARAKLGLADDDYSPEAIEQLSDFLDAQSDELLTPPDTQSALVRLAERGDLPSDLYEIAIIKEVADVYGKRFGLEKQIIETTIRAPNVEQHFGPPRDPHEPAMISLFLRRFRTKWPLRDFFMLAAGQRDGFTLHVHQAWRIYPLKIDVTGLKAPVDWLRRFADRFGAEIEVDGKLGNFFLTANAAHVPNQVKIIPGKKPGYVTVSQFNQPFSSDRRAALIVAIDILKYRAVLDELVVKREDILDEFAPAPRPSD